MGVPTNNTLSDLSADSGKIVNPLLVCKVCNYRINDAEHLRQCITVHKYQLRYFDTTVPADTFRPIMTYGLYIHSAMIMVLFEKDTGTVRKVIFGTHNNNTQIVDWWNENYNAEYNIVTIIKTPGYYSKKDGLYELRATNEEYFISHIPGNNNNNKLILEPYFTEHPIHINPEGDYNHAWYFQMGGSEDVNNNGARPMYSNGFGKFIDIVY